MSEWKFYNRGWVSACAPHMVPDIKSIENGNIWHKGGLFVRWTSHFDCPEKTGWYFVIKDQPFEMSQVNSNARNRLRKGLKSFTVREIESKDHIDEICRVYQGAWSQYPEKYRPEFDYEKVRQGVKHNIRRMVGAFSNIDGKLVGFATFMKHKDGYYSFPELKSMPEAEKLNVNAALIYGRLEAIKEDLKEGVYGCSGETNILHETAYQDYLVEKFAFRKVNCHLHLAYHPKIKWVVMALYPFRRLFKGWNVRILDLVYAVLKMEEISRHCKKLRGER